MEKDMTCLRHVMSFLLQMTTLKKNLNQMKNLFLISFILTFFFLKVQDSFAQTYQPMAVEGAHWVIQSDRLSTLWLDEKFVLSIRGDTIIQGQSYKKVYKEPYEFDESRKVFLKNIAGSSLYALMRDDTTQRKVYAIMGETAYDNCADSEEYLLFDFSLTSGDTLSWCSLQEFKLDPEKPHIVDSSKVASSYPTGGERKVLYAVLPFIGYLDATISEETMPIIEGFGYEHYGPFIVGTSVEKYCVGTLEECELITDTEDISQTDIHIFPNPAADFIYVDVKNRENASFQYQLFSVDGKKMREGYLQGDKVSIQDLPTGLFFLFIRFEGKDIVLIEKILIHR